MLLCPILTSENATKATPKGGGVVVVVVVTGARGCSSRVGGGHSQQRVKGVGAAGPQPSEHTGSGTRVTWALGSTPDTKVPGLACVTQFPRDLVPFVKAVCKPNFQTHVRIRNDARRALAHDIGPISHSCTAGHCRTPLLLTLLCSNVHEVLQRLNSLFISARLQGNWIVMHHFTHCKTHRQR